MQSSGLYKEFILKTTENPRPNDIPEDEWVFDHPLRWQTENYLENFNSVTLATLTQEEERIEYTLEMLEEVPQVYTDEGASELASKQHRTWISELLCNSWTPNVIADMNAFEEEIQDDGVLLFYVFLREHIGFTNEAIIAAEAQLTKEKLALENFQFNILKFTTHVRTYIRQMMGAGQQPTKQHFIFVFSALKEVEEEEFKLIIMKLYQEWRSGTGDGANLTMLQLLARAGSEYKRLHQLGQWTTKHKASELMGLQAKFDLLQTQFAALLSEHTKLKQASKPPPSNRPNGEPKPEEKEERIINGEKWYYCSKCFIARRWNKTHKTDEHQRGVGKSKNKDTDKDKSDDIAKQQALTASYDLGFGAEDFQLG
jgi:hypothetical protein